MIREERIKELADEHPCIMNHITYAHYWTQEEVVQFARLIEAEAQKVQWQPIGTAPKDGTAFLGYRNGKYREATPVAFVGELSPQARRELMEKGVAVGAYLYLAPPTEAKQEAKPVAWLHLISDNDDRESWVVDFNPTHTFSVHRGDTPLYKSPPTEKQIRNTALEDAAKMITDELYDSTLRRNLLNKLRAMKED